MDSGPAIIWVLKSFRAGDNAQALALAEKVGGSIVEKQMAYNHLAVLPNLLGGISLRMLTKEAKKCLVEPWPDLVVATGRRNAVISLWIKKQSGGKAKVVQLGRPRLPLHLFDLVITTPQYGLPQAQNVISLPLPFVPERPVKPDQQSDFHVPWREMPRPWIVAVVGGQKFPLRLGKKQLEAFGLAINAFASKKIASVNLLDSPRSSKDALASIARKITQPKWQPASNSENPYRAALASGDYFCVTADSVSMISEMLATKKPVLAYELPESPLMPHWNAQHGIAAKLAAKGWLGPPRNVKALTRALHSQNIIGDLKTAVEPSDHLAIAQQQEAAVQRVRRLI